MAKGGARSRSGPAPEPTAARRDRKDDGEWLTLDKAGRKGKTPAWPLSPAANNREKSLWAKLWRTPQAIAWEQNQTELEVAMYVRRLAEAEQRKTATNLSTLVRQMADSLGLTTVGLRSNRWKIEAPAEDGAGSSSSGGGDGRGGARERFGVIDGGKAS